MFNYPFMNGERVHLIYTPLFLFMAIQMMPVSGINWQNNWH